MQRLWMVFLFLCVASNAAFAQETVAGKNSREAEILNRGKEAVIASLRGDVEFFRTALAEDYVGISAVTGRQTSKRDTIANFRSGNVKYESIERSELQVHFYGDNTALLTGVAKVKGKVGQVDFSGDYRFSQLFVKKHGRWQIAFLQATAIPK